MDFLPIKRALFSVTEKKELVPFATYLAENGVELVSTGGTCQTLRDAGLTVTQVSDVTGFPEIMGGRVKTLHPHIHGGILADKDNKEHLDVIKKLHIAPFDLICVNLYNFSDVVKKQVEFSTAIEQIDVGGPCMLRAAAKNYHSVAVVPSPRWYKQVMEELSKNSMKLSLTLRQQLAVDTFSTTASYDRMIADYLGKD